MREYEFTVIYDLEVTESGGEEASVQALTSHVEARGGRVISTDHWGRRRMAYPISGALDGDYIVTRVELPTDVIQELNDALRIDEKVFRHLLVRADELPPPAVPREPRRPRPEPGDAEGQPTPPTQDASATPTAAASTAEAPAAAAPAAEETAAAAPAAEEPAAAAPAAEEPAAAAPAAEEPAAAAPEAPAAEAPTDVASTSATPPSDAAVQEGATEASEVSDSPDTVDSDTPPAE